VPGLIFVIVAPLFNVCCGSDVNIAKQRRFHCRRVPSGDEISFPKRELRQKNYDMSVTLGDKRPSYSTVKNWVAGFRTGHLSTDDEKRSGRPTQVTFPENVQVIHSMILDDISISAGRIAEILPMSRSNVGCIIHEMLDIRKLSAKCLNGIQNRDRLLASQAILDRIRRDPVRFFNRPITMDETWIHIQDPDTKEQSKEWRHSHSPWPKTFKTLKSSSEALASAFWDKDGFFRLPGKGCNLHGNVLRCTSFQSETATGLQTSRQAIERNLVSSHGTRNWQISTLKFWNTQPTHLIGTSDNYIFSNLKKHLKGRKFSSTEEATAADWRFVAQLK
jgi:hypothetical protein